MALLRISMPGDLNKLTGKIGEEVEVTFATLKGLLSARGYRDVGPAYSPGYRRWCKDIDGPADSTVCAESA